MSKRQPARRQPARRKPSARAKSAGPTPAQLATRLLGELREELASDEPLQHELAASYAMSTLYPTFWEAEDPAARDALHPADRVLKLIAEVREANQRDAAARLASAVERLARDDDATSELAAKVLEKLRFLGAKSAAPAQEEPEAVTLDGCLLLRDVFADELTLFVGVRHPGHEAHTMIVTMLQSSTLDLVEIGVGDPIDQVAANVRGSLVTEPDAADHLRVADVDPIEAGVLLLTALDSVEATRGEGLDVESLDLFALLDGRVAQLFDELLTNADVFASGDVPISVTPVSSNASELDALGAAAIAERFLASDEFAAHADATREDGAAIVDWARAEVGGGVARIGPMVVEMYVHDLEEAGQQLTAPRIAAVRAWIDFCARLTSIPDDARTAIHEMLGELSASA